MDKIELVVTHQAGGPVGRHWSAIFGMAGGTVGRAGQNKLVLPDDDAMVARVHAMVRLDSDQAYIANLCERRSVQVDGQDVLSGQEVPLVPGAEIGIGPYQLRAVLPGQQPQPAATRTAPASPAARIAPGLDTAVAPVAGPVTSAYLAPPGAPEPELGAAARPAVPAAAQAAVASPLDLASLPNPWADIPPIVDGGPHIQDLIFPGLPEASVPPASGGGAEDPNPFAMLGRVEAPLASEPAAEPAHPLLAPPAPPAALSSPSPSSASPSPWPAAAPTATDADIAAAGVAELLPASFPAEQALPNPFEASGAASGPAPAKAAAHRAMVIPDDFDPFAVDPKEAASHRDPWSGDLAAKSLAEVAQLKHDDLLQALPRTGQFAGEMDNAAHTGLPQQLDPAIELNPLKLFREPGESMYAEPENHGMSRGSDLAQVFSMPRDAQQRRSHAEADAAAPSATAAAGAGTLAAHAVHAAQAAPPAPAESVVQAGLHAMQGLDLALFGGDSQQAPVSAELLGMDAFGAAPGDAAPAAAPSAGAGNDCHAPGASALPDAAAVPAARTASAASAAAAPQAEPVPATPATPAVPAVAAANPARSEAHPAHASAATPTPAAPATGSIAPSASTPASTPSAPPASLDALAAAFLEGAAIEPGKVNIAVTPDFMRAFGEALRIAVQGSIDLLSARSEIKREFRADVTIIASGANNPLKFLPTADGVMLQLAGQTFPGFMKPVPAMKEAYKDLAVHQIALMAGIRAAYAEAVARLSPAALEKDATAATGLLAKVSSVHRKAALWDDFQQRYESVRRHAEDDLMAFSGQTFVDAYEAAAQAAEGTL